MKSAALSIKASANLRHLVSASRQSAALLGCNGGGALTKRCYRTRDCAGSEGFTLAEVLAALLFMAIVIPVAVQGLQIANRAGEVAERKSQAARIAERVLNENIVTTNWTQSSQAGTVYEGTREFRWTLRSEPWSQNLTNQSPAQSQSMGQLLGGQPQVTATASSQTTLNLLSVEVTYKVQNRDYLLRLSTLMNSLQ